MNEMHPQSNAEVTAPITPEEFVALADDMQYGTPRNLASAEALVQDVQAHANTLEQGPDGTYHVGGEPVDASTAHRLMHLAEAGVEHWRIEPEELVFTLELSKAAKATDLDPDMQAFISQEQAENEDDYATFERVKRDAQARLKLHREIQDYYGAADSSDVEARPEPSTNDEQLEEPRGAEVAPEPQTNEPISEEIVASVEPAYDSPTTTNEVQPPTTKTRLEELDSSIDEWSVPSVAELRDGAKLNASLTRESDGSYRDEAGSYISAELVDRVREKTNPEAYIFSKDEEKAYKALMRADSASNLRGGKYNLDEMLKEYTAAGKAEGAPEDFDFLGGLKDTYKHAKELSDWLKAHSRESAPENTREARRSVSEILREQRDKRRSRQEAPKPTVRSAAEIRQLTGVDQHDADFKRRLLIEELTDTLGHYPTAAELNPYLPEPQRDTTVPKHETAPTPRAGERQSETWSRVRKGLSKVALSAARATAPPQPRREPDVAEIRPDSEYQLQGDSLAARIENARRLAEAQEEDDELVSTSTQR